MIFRVLQITLLLGVLLCSTVAFGQTGVAAQPNTGPAYR
jgi:hypothetical protein